MISKWTNEEINVLKQLAGQKPAAVIAAIMGKTKNSVHYNIKKHGLDGRLYGENHWNAKIDNITAQMIGVLYDSGFTVNEISRVFDYNIQTVDDICACRTRVNDGINSKTHRR